MIPLHVKPPLLHSVGHWQCSTPPSSFYHPQEECGDSGCSRHQRGGERRGEGIRGSLSILTLLESRASKGFFLKVLSCLPMTSSKTLLFCSYGESHTARQDRMLPSAWHTLKNVFQFKIFQLWPQLLLTFWRTTIQINEEPFEAPPASTGGHKEAFSPTGSAPYIAVSKEQITYDVKADLGF